jgi:hypothetical protein
MGESSGLRSTATTGIDSVMRSANSSSPRTLIRTRPGDPPFGEVLDARPFAGDVVSAVADQYAQLEGVGRVLDRAGELGEDGLVPSETIRPIVSERPLRSDRASASGR